MEDNGYWRVQVKNRHISSARIVWVLTHGEDPWPLEVDHKDRDRSNNRASNFTLKTRRGQQYNRRKKSGTKSEFKYVVWDKRKNRWLARYKCPIEGRILHVGTFRSDLEAHVAALDHMDRRYGAGRVGLPGFMR